MSLFFAVGIYLFARGVFALFGQSIFYTKRTLQSIEASRLPAYLKEVGIWNTATGFLFVAKAILDVALPGNKMVWVLFLIGLVVCLIFLSKCNEKYIKKTDESEIK